MALKTIYEQIKKQNGERFARAIREYDSGIFEVPDIVGIVKYAGCDAKPVLEFLSSLKKREYEDVVTTESPFELLKKAGYNAFYADTLEKQMSIEKYFALTERLCTFRDIGRFQKYHIIHCVKEGAEKLNRSDFNNPERQDEYGTSVISIQIIKEGSFIKITNRYNHVVQNQDNTFDSNPDNIIKGLSRSLERYFSTKIIPMGKVSLPAGFIFAGNRLFKYFKEKENTFIGESGYVRDGVVYPINKDNEIIIDNFILKLKTKGFIPIAEPFNIETLDILKEEVKAGPLQIKSYDRGHKAVLIGKKKFLEYINGEVFYMHLEKAKVLPSYFMQGNYSLKVLSAPNVRFVERCVLNPNMRFIYMPKLCSYDDRMFCDTDISRRYTGSSACLLINRNNRPLNAAYTLNYKKDFTR